MNKTAFRGALGGAILFVAVLAAAKAPPEIRTELKVEFAPVSQSRHLSVETPIFAYDGASWQREYAWSTNTVKVRSGAYVRLDYAWRKLEWNFGSYFLPVMRFTDRAGKLVRDIGFDATNIKGACYPMFESDSPAGRD